MSARDYAVVTIAPVGDRTIIHTYGPYTKPAARAVRDEIIERDTAERGLDKAREVHVSVHRLLKDDRDVELGR